MTAEPVDVLHRFLDAHRVAHLSTAGEGGPHGAPVFYARLPASADLVWWSTRVTQHSRHIDAGARIAVSVASSTPDLERIEGVQMHGTAALAGDAQDELQQTFFVRYPAARHMPIWEAEHRLYLFRPTWARLVRLVGGTSRDVEWRLSP